MAHYSWPVVLVALLTVQGVALAHGTKSHEDEPEHLERLPAAENRVRAVQSDGGAGTLHTVGESIEPNAAGDHSKVIGSKLTIGEIVNDLTWTDFPTLHPMIVHLPVTLIPLAFVFALFGIFTVQRIFLWLALAFTLLGLLSGWMAAFPAHPHTTGLSAAARLTLDKHDYFAYTTLWLTALAVPLAAISLWKANRLPRLGLALVLLLSSFCVAITGHYGGTLAYVHGVGVQGRFLSSD